MRLIQLSRGRLTLQPRSRASVHVETPDGLRADRVENRIIVDKEYAPYGVPRLVACEFQ